MGRYINASIIGRNNEDQIVHKFWFAIQPSDVSDYLEAYEVAGEPEEWVFALLNTDREAAIKRTITDLKHVLDVNGLCRRIASPEILP